MIENGSQIVSGLSEKQSSQELIKRALPKILMEFSPVVLEAASSLTLFNFLLDQVCEAVPGVHPMECAIELYSRLVVTTERKAIADAFVMGTLIASSVRGKSKEYNESIKKEILAGSKATPDWLAQSKSESSTPIA